MSQSSGEKNLPPSARKLRKMREEEGQIAHSRDLAQTVNLSAMMIYFFATGESILRQVAIVFEQLAYLQGRVLTNELIGEMLSGVMSITVAIIVYPLMIAMLVSLIVGLIDAQGVVFSTKPIMPKLSHLNPLKGFKKIFGSQGLVYLAMNFTRAILMLVVTVVVGFIFLRPIVLSATCTFGCAMNITYYTSIVLSLICVGIMIASLVFELPLSRAFFTKEMKMTHEEAKREEKDISGDPTIKVARQNIRNAGAGEFVGTKFISILYCGPGSVAGIHYARGRTAAPVMCLRAQGDRIPEVIEAARDLNAVIIYNTGLAAGLYRNGTNGQFIPVDFFDSVAEDLVRYGLL